jgi:trigger factor
MEVSIENTGGLARRMTVQVPAERVDQEVKSRLQSMCQTVRLDGFRPGKVPLKVIEQKYGKQIRLEVADQVVNSTLQEAITQENVRPAGVPSVEPKELVPGEPLEYTATFEIFPELSGNIEYSFSVSKPLVEITEDDVAGMLENLRSQRGTWNVVERASQADDQVTVDFEGSVDGQPFTGNKGEKVPVVLGSGAMVPGFEEQLIGVSAGDEKTLDITFPDNYPARDVAGKAASFNVKVHAVSEIELPALNDDFARAFGIEEAGIEGLKDEIRENMNRELKGLVASKLKEQVFNGLMDANPVEVPATLVDGEIQQLRAKQQEGVSQDASEIEAKAERRVKLGVIVSEIAKHNQLQIDPDRVRQMVETIASSYEKPEEVVQWYYGNQEMLSGVQSAVIEEQVVDWIVEHSGVDLKEVKTTFSALVEEAKQSQGT